MRLFVSAAALSLALAGGAQAQTSTDQTPSEQPAAQPAAAPATPAATVASNGKGGKAKDGLICHKEMVTGSQFPVKVCTTPEERQAQRRMAQRAQETMQAPTPVIPN